MNKQIKIDDEFSMESDGKQWTLRYCAKREVAEKDGSKKVVTSSDEWYCGSTATILKIYVEKSLKKSGLASLKELTDKVESLFTKIDELWESKTVFHSPVTKKIKFVVDPPESADEAEDESAADGLVDVLGDMF